MITDSESGIESSAPGRRWELYRLLGEPLRLRLLALVAHEELGVGELAELLGEPQPNVSRAVSALRSAALVTVRKQGTRVLVRAPEDAGALDPVIKDAIATGRSMCEADGSLARVAALIRARDEAAREFFSRPNDSASATAFAPELPAYMSALATLLPNRGLAVDVGTGDGALLDVLAPSFERVIAVDRADVQLARAKKRVDARGYTNVSLLRGDLDDSLLRKRVTEAGGADVVFASRVLHHSPRPQTAISALASLLRPGGALIVIDYASHDDDRMRDEQADLWLGFESADLLAWTKAAGLASGNVQKISKERHGTGPDRHLTWLLLVARRPDKS